MAEDYKPQKHEFGTPASASWAKSMTPGQEGSIGIPDGKASMKFKDVRPKKEKVEETVSGRSFFQYREDLSEEISHRRLSKKINYSGTPRRPQRRVSMPTRELLANMKPLTDRKAAQKEKGLYRRAKEVWGAGLPSIKDAGQIFVRELRIKGGYKYFFSFDEVLPHFVATSEKKIPKKDLEFLIPEFEYMTYAAFGRKWSAPDKESVNAAIAGGPPGTDPDYVPKQWKPEKLGPSYKMKGSNDYNFTISNYHKKSFGQSYYYTHPEDGSIVRISHAFRFGSAEVAAPSIKELITKIEKDGGFNSEKWEDFDFEYGEDGGHGGESEILQGPKGIRPDTDAYEEWEEKVEYASEEELEDELGYEYTDEEGYEIWGPIKIEDEDYNTYVYDPDMETSPEDDEKHIVSADEVVELPEGWESEPPVVKDKKLESIAKDMSYDSDETRSALDEELWETFLINLGSVQKSFDRLTMYDDYGLRRFTDWGHDKLKSDLRQYFVDHEGEDADEIDEMLADESESGILQLMHDADWDWIEKNGSGYDYESDFDYANEQFIFKHENPIEFLNDLESYENRAHGI